MSGSTNTHAKLAPSGASCWTTCTASVRHVELNQHRIPEERDSVFSLEGTQAHDYAEEVLTGEKLISDLPEDFQEAVKVYTDECQRIQALHPDYEIFVEEKAPLWYSPDDNGTVDFAAVGNNHVFIRDLKHGAGVFVKVEGNKQLAIYAKSLVVSLEDDGFYEFEPDAIIDIGIAQPRHHVGDPVRNWVITLADLNDFCKDIEDAVELIASGDTVYAPSEDACRWCDVRLFCEARNAELTVGMPETPTGIDFLAALPKLDQRGEVPKHNKKTIPERLDASFGRAMNDSDLLEIYKRKKGLQALLKDVDDYFLERGLAGDPVEGTKMVMGNEGNRKWVDETAAETFLANQKVCKADRSKSVLISLAQAEKLPELKDKLNPKSDLFSTRFANRFKALTHRAPGREVIALEDDKRPSVSVALDALPELDDDDLV